MVAHSMRRVSLSQTRFVTRVVYIISVAILFQLLGCRQAMAPGERSAIFYTQEDDTAGVQWWCSFEAPVIFSGQIESISYTEEAKDVGTYGFSFAKATLKVGVGEVLKGELTGSQCEIEGYVLRTPGVEIRKRNPPVPAFEASQKRIFVARMYEGKLRLARDMYDHTLRIYGETKLTTDYSNLRVREKAAVLLLWPPSLEESGEWAQEFNILLAQAHHLASGDFILKLTSDERFKRGIPSGSRTTVDRELKAFRTYAGDLTMSLGDSHTAAGCPDFGQQR